MAEASIFQSLSTTSCMHSSAPSTDPAAQEAGGALAVLLLLAALAPLCCWPRYRRCCFSCLSCCGRCALPGFWVRGAAARAEKDAEDDAQARCPC